MEADRCAIETMGTALQKSGRPLIVTSGLALLAAGRVPVIAPYRWLREADPLPHSWDVTSDSIAAWLASALGAARLVLVKPPGATGDDALSAPAVKLAVAD